MPEARIGKAVHAAIERALQGILLPQALEEGKKDLTDPAERDRFDALCEAIPSFLERVERFRRQRRVSRSLIEFNLGVREDGSATAFYAGDSFYRGVIDAAFLYDGDQLAMVDHKSGVRYPNMSITEQLEGYAVLASSHFRGVRRVWLGVHWMRDAEVEWGEPLSLGDVKRTLVPKVMNNIEAAALAVEDGPRANPGAWCYRCNYRSICPAGYDVRFEPVEPLEEHDAEPETGLLED